MVSFISKLGRGFRQIFRFDPVIWHFLASQALVVGDTRKVKTVEALIGSAATPASLMLRAAWSARASPESTNREALCSCVYKGSGFGKFGLEWLAFQIQGKCSLHRTTTSPHRQWFGALDHT